MKNSYQELEKRYKLLMGYIHEYYIKCDYTYPYIISLEEDAFLNNEYKLYNYYYFFIKTVNDMHSHTRKIKYKQIVNLMTEIENYLLEWRLSS